MFSASKNIICLIYNKSCIVCALASVHGKKVDILSIDSIDFEDGILVDGVIYDKYHLQEVTKSLITSVAKGVSEIDTAWISIPDNKVLISKFEINKPHNEISPQDINRAIENKLNSPADYFYSYYSPIHEINKRVFYLSYSVRREHIEPFIEIFQEIGISVSSIFPNFETIYKNLNEYIKYPTLVLYPNDVGYKFFVADSDGVYLESVWGHNVIELNEDFDKAIKEIINYTKQTREIALGIKKILIIEGNPETDKVVQGFMSKLTLEHLWVPSGVEEGSNLFPTAILGLKGLITLAMSVDHREALGLNPLVESRPTHYESSREKHYTYAPPLRSVVKLQKPDISTKNYVEEKNSDTLLRTDSDSEPKWNFKIILTTLLLIVLVIAGLVYLGIQINNRRTDGSLDKDKISSSPSPNLSPAVPTTKPTITPTPEDPPPTPTPTPILPAKEEVIFKVFNGNSVGGEASRISGIISNLGFTPESPQNYTRFDVQSTVVQYNSAELLEYAKEIADTLSKSGYPSANTELVTTEGRALTIILGVQ